MMSGRLWGVSERFPGSRRDPRGSRKVSGGSCEVSGNHRKIDANMVCVISLGSFRWSLGCPWVVSNDVWALRGFSKKNSGGVLKVSGNCRKVPGAFSDAEMESLIYVYFFRWSLRALGRLGRLK